MYSKAVRQQRRCKAIKPNGEPCRAYAVWGDTLCAAHRYSHEHRGEPGRVRGWVVTPNSITPLTESAAKVLACRGFRYSWDNKLTGRRPSCKCGGLAYPHRPGCKGCALSDSPSLTANIDRAVAVTPSKEAAKS